MAKPSAPKIAVIIVHASPSLGAGFERLKTPIIRSIGEEANSSRREESNRGGAMHTLTGRRQNVTVMTVSTLRNHLERVSSPTCRFAVHQVRRDRVSVRGDYVLSGRRKHSYVLLPAYPTGSPDDAPCNNLNVVLDPLAFVDVDTCTERDVFAPVFGHEILAYYEKMHPHADLPMSRCC